MPVLAVLSVYNYNKATMQCGLPSITVHFHGNLTSIYVSKKNTTFILLSSQHHIKSYIEESQAFKREIILHFNATKGDINVVDNLAKGTQRAKKCVGCLSDCSAIHLMYVVKMYLYSGF